MIQIYALKIEQVPGEMERTQILDMLTPERKAKALRFRRLDDQVRGMAAGILENYAFWKEYGISKEQIKVEQGGQGKPYLSGHPDKFYNISHAGKWVVCGISNQPIGVDVESTTKYKEQLVKHFFHEEEVTDILSQPTEQRADVFAMHWTMKESFMKLCGLGFSLPFSSFETNRLKKTVTILPTISEENRQQLLQQGLMGTHRPACQWIPLEAGYQCCVCTKEYAETETHIVTIEECISEIMNSK